MSVFISSQHQLQRIQQLRSTLETYRSLSVQELQWKKEGQGWNIAEVMKHMVISQALYIPKIEQALKAKERSEKPSSQYKAHAIAAYLIKRFPPSHGKIRMKMKTMKVFEPHNVNLATAIDALEDSLVQLTAWIEYTQGHDFSRKRFSSAVGSLIRFNVPEACEFILCHNERHFQQIAHILKANGKF